jgi:hypothetical protein
MVYFSMPKAGHKVEDVLRVGGPDMYSMGSPIMAATTTLKEISVFPQAVQKPHPQVGEPVTSACSIRWAAQPPNPPHACSATLTSIIKKRTSTAGQTGCSAAAASSAGTPRSTAALAAATMDIYPPMAKVKSRSGSVTKRHSSCGGITTGPLALWQSCRISGNPCTTCT